MSSLSRSLATVAAVVALVTVVSGCPPPPCQPATCEALGKNCGSVGDGCGGTLSCGTCSGGDACTQGVCTCVPETDAEICSAQGRTCGSVTATDRCGAQRTVSSCGTCSGTGQTCGGGGVAGACGCTPEVDGALCNRNGRFCGELTAADNCGVTRTVASCGTCSGTGQTCGGSGVEGVCGCTPETDQEICTAQGRTCGPAAATTDRCGNARTVTSCGSCSGAGQTCGGGGTEGACGCTPQSDPAFCASLSISCGPASGLDNCGQSRSVSDCGTCSLPQTCGGGGTQGVCGCTSQTDAEFCAARNATCGVITGADNCGVQRTVTCGFSCGSTATCGGGGVPNRCGLPAAPIAGQVCTFSRVCYEMPKPSSVHATAAFALSANDVWVVGQGVIQHWNGTSWSGVLLPNFYFDDVWASGPNDVWVVGVEYSYPGPVLSPVILRGGPMGFEPIAPYDYDEERVYSVSGSGPDDVWFLGAADPSFGSDYEYLDRWNGSQLQRALSFAQQISTPVRMVEVVSPTERYVLRTELNQVGQFSLTPVPNTSGMLSLQAVGTELWGSGTSGRVFRRQAGNWISYAAGASSISFRGVWGTSPSDVWAFGSSSAGGAITHFDGNAWTPSAGSWPSLTATSPGATPVAVGPYGEVWTVSGNAPVRYSGAGLPRPGNRPLRRIAGPDSSHFWIVGDRVLLRNDGGTWTEPAAAGAPNYASGLYVASPADVWVGGSFSSVEDVRRFDGASWTTTGANARGELEQAHGSLWLGQTASNVLKRWSGSAWVPETTPISSLPDVWIEGLSAGSTGGLYVATSSTRTAIQSQLLRRDPGGLWATVNSTSGTGYSDVLALSDTQVWVASSPSLYFDGAQWTSTFTTLNRISGTAAANVCAVGSNAYLWNGAGWTSLGSLNELLEDAYADDGARLFLGYTALFRYHP